jgi:hypothetical protein
MRVAVIEFLSLIYPTIRLHFSSFLHNSVNFKLREGIILIMVFNSGFYLLI